MSTSVKQSIDHVPTQLKYWAVKMYEIVETANNMNIEYEDSWHYSNTLGDA